MALLIKNLNSLAYASVKNRNALAVASIKNINGLDATSAANWWEAGGATGCVLAYQPKGAASYAASIVNLANPGTYDAADPYANPPSWNTSTGWGFTGSLGTNVLSTGYTPSNGNVTMICQYTGANSPAFSIFAGSLVTGSYFYFGAFSTNDGFSNGPVADGAIVSVPRPSGNFCIAGLDGYADGSSVGTDTGPVAGTLYPIYIGDADFINSPAGRPASFTAVAFAMYSGVLNASEVAAVAAAMAAL